MDSDKHKILKKIAIDRNVSLKTYILQAIDDRVMFEKQYEINDDENR